MTAFRMHIKGSNQQVSTQNRVSEHKPLIRRSATCEELTIKLELKKIGPSFAIVDKSNIANSMKAVSRKAFL